MIECALLRGRDRYERVVDGWIDNTHEDAFTHTVRLMDDDLGVELSAVATGSPPTGSPHRAVELQNRRAHS